jgi:hypothetical protein
MSNIENSPFSEKWQKEIENKSYKELVEIVARKESYNTDFVILAQEKLKSCEEYDEEQLNKLVAEINKQPQPKQKDPANLILKIVNIGCTTFFALSILMFVIMVLVTGGDSSSMNNGMKGGMAIIIWGIGIGLYKIGKHYWKK